MDIGAGVQILQQSKPVGRKLKVMATSSKKVVFFFPAFSSQEATAPLGILAVATPLLRAAYAHLQVYENRRAASA